MGLSFETLDGSEPGSMKDLHLPPDPGWTMQSPTQDSPGEATGSSWMVKVIQTWGCSARIYSAPNCLGSLSKAVHFTFLSKQLFKFKFNLSKAKDSKAKNEKVALRHYGISGLCVQLWFSSAAFAFLLQNLISKNR